MKYGEKNENWTGVSGPETTVEVSSLGFLLAKFIHLELGAGGAGHLNVVGRYSQKKRKKKKKKPQQQLVLSGKMMRKGMRKDRCILNYKTSDTF